MRENRVALVVGASSGFGMGAARELLAEGFIVFAAARRLEPMQPLAALGARLLSMDVTDESSVRSSVTRIMAEAGRIDVVMNNAGYGAYGAVEAVPLDEAKRQFDTNLFGLARVNNAVLPVMRQQRSGRIIITASLASHINTPGSGWYNASKHAVKALAETLRMELAGTGIRIIQIEPGPVQTQFEDVALAGLDRRETPADYVPLMATVRRYLVKAYAASPGPDSTVRAMINAALMPHPRAVYRTTMLARVLPPLRALMGTALFGWAVRRIYAGAGND